MWQGNYFIGDKTSPYQISVGGVVINDEGKIYCHHFSNVTGGDMYSLMRETLKPNDTLESALVRGLKKEFGLEARLITYIGSIVSSFINWEGVEIEKTTLYFLCREPKIVDEHPQRESFEMKPSVIEWHPPEFLIEKMETQEKLTKRSDFNESKVLYCLIHNS